MCFILSLLFINVVFFFFFCWSTKKIVHFRYSRRCIFKCGSSTFKSKAQAQQNQGKSKHTVTRHSKILTIYLKSSSSSTTCDIGNQRASRVCRSRSSKVFKWPPVCLTIKLNLNHAPSPTWVLNKCWGSPSSKLSSWSSRLQASCNV